MQSIAANAFVVRVVVRKRMSPRSYTALLNEIETLKEEIEDLRASAISWRELYEACAKRCAKNERMIRKLTRLLSPPKKRRRGRIH
jgi:hypothetical protein